MKTTILALLLSMFAFLSVVIQQRTIEGLLRRMEALEAKTKPAPISITPGQGTVRAPTQFTPLFPPIDEKVCAPLLSGNGTICREPWPADFEEEFRKQQAKKGNQGAGGAAPLGGSGLDPGSNR